MKLVMDNLDSNPGWMRRWWLVKDKEDFIFFSEIEVSAASGIAGIKFDDEQIEHYKGIGKPYLDFYARRLQYGSYKWENIAWEPYRNLLLPND